MKRILFPTDFSEAANHAFIYALEIAKAFQLPLTVLHVYQLPDISSVPPALPQRQYSRQRRAAAKDGKAAKATSRQRPALPF